MTREQIEAIERLLAKATPGPWWAQREYDGGRTVCNMRHQTETVCINKATHVEGNPWDKHWDNANLIQELRNNAAALIAAAREALELREALEFLASEGVILYEDNDGEYCCSVRLGAQDYNFYGATPLEAINRARLVVVLRAKKQEAHDAE